IILWIPNILLYAMQVLFTLVCIDVLLTEDRTECNFEQERREIERLPHVCGFVSLVRTSETRVESLTPTCSNECAKLIIQSGISEVVFYGDKYHNDWQFVASRKMFEAAGIKYWQHRPKLARIVLDFEASNLS